LQFSPVLFIEILQRRDKPVGRSPVQQAVSPAPLLPTTVTRRLSGTVCGLASICPIGNTSPGK
jgi:hypothetical protein